MIALWCVIRYICPKLAGFLRQAVNEREVTVPDGWHPWKGFYEDDAWVSRRFERGRYGGWSSDAFGLHG